jgi:hypothetical protein
VNRVVERNLELKRTAERTQANTKPCHSCHASTLFRERLKFVCSTILLSDRGSRGERDHLLVALFFFLMVVSIRQQWLEHALER